MCKECCNLITNFYDKKYFKCRIYGNSCSEATDWRLKYEACGMFNKGWSGGDIVRLVSRTSWRNEEQKPLDGQFDLLEE